MTFVTPYTINLHNNLVWSFARHCLPLVSRLYHSPWFHNHNSVLCWPEWPRGLRRRSAAARLMRLWVWIPPGVWMFVCCECCVLSGRCLCDELITRPEESYWLWCVVVCDLETSWMRRPLPTGGSSAKNKQTIVYSDECFWQWSQAF